MSEWVGSAEQEAWRGPFRISKKLAEESHSISIFPFSSEMDAEVEFES